MTTKFETAEIVRFGQTLYVLAYETRTTGASPAVTREFCEAHPHVWRFTFDGRAVSSNPSFASALSLAKTMCRRAVK